MLGVTDFDEVGRVLGINVGEIVLVKLGLALVGGTLTTKVGITVESTGLVVGTALRKAVGGIVGNLLGAIVRMAVGRVLGMVVFAAVGFLLGDIVGMVVGAIVGDDVG